MIDMRPYKTLGGGHHGWLKTRHHFSFADYQEEERDCWGALSVWNDNEIAPGAGFPAHPHANIDIITFVRQGAIIHDDSLGNSARMEAGSVQVLSAGSGIRHSEYNADGVPAHLFQIWIKPEQSGGQPEWTGRRFPKSDRAGEFVILASGFQQDQEAAPLRSGARVLGLTLTSGQRIEYRPDRNRHLYLVPASGKVLINGIYAAERDGIAVADEDSLVFEALDDCEIVMVDAP
ncbi:pirin family protein [Acidisoma cellulosilytica]|uniref:Pirin family protein n=1 Tax=Acidisoma cellulosilyticum TaxID=2802395 RepID=A0A963YXQ8_9PROT|nr:pirin-like bicupin family protein [Acidisoma cellulosilyticum]MCB8879081.1 pirin family protein [Acidisoma cellulosilyticum]